MADAEVVRNTGEAKAVVACRADRGQSVGEAVPLDVRIAFASDARLAVDVRSFTGGIGDGKNACRQTGRDSVGGCRSSLDDWLVDGEVFVGGDWSDCGVRRTDVGRGSVCANYGAALRLQETNHVQAVTGAPHVAVPCMTLPLVVYHERALASSVHWIQVSLTFCCTSLLSLASDLSGKVNP